MSYSFDFYLVVFEMNRQCHQRRRVAIKGSALLVERSLKPLN